MAGTNSGESGVRGGIYPGIASAGGTPPPMSRRPTSGTMPAVGVPSNPPSNPVIRSDSAPRVLLIEDEVASRHKLEQMLAKKGAEVTSVAGPGEALYALSMMEEWVARPVMVILDVLMPGLDGPLFVATLRQHPKIGGAPIVLISALAAPVLERTMHDWAADGFILKARGLLHIDQAFDAWIARLRARAQSGPPNSKRGSASSNKIAGSGS